MWNIFKSKQRKLQEEELKLRKENTLRFNLLTNEQKELFNFIYIDFYKEKITTEDRFIFERRTAINHNELIESLLNITNDFKTKEEFIKFKDENKKQ